MAGKGSVNKIIIIGNLGADPELRNLPDGSSVVNLSVATTDSYTDKSGQKVEKTEWHRVSFFGRPAEIIHEYMRKGSKIYVEGSVQTRKYQDKEGNDRYITEVRGFREFTFLSGRDDAGGGGGAPSSPPSKGGDNFSDMDDVPF